MITNQEQLRLTREALANVEGALYALKVKVLEKNPELYYAMAQDYLEDIEEMRNQIDKFLGLSNLLEYKVPLWIRIAGNYIDVWNTPISVWSHLLLNLKNSVSSVAKILKTDDIPDYLINNFSDFQVSAVAHGSLKLGFKIYSENVYELFPKPLDISAMKTVETALTKILETSNWFERGTNIHELDLLFESEDIRDFVISRTMSLMPSTKSKFEVIEFSGSILPVAEPIKLRAENRKRIRELIKKQIDEEEMNVIGIIREIDLDKKHLILRQREDGGADLQCNFGETKYNQVKGLLDTKVRITGVIKKGRQTPLYLKFVEIIEVE